MVETDNVELNNLYFSWINPFLKIMVRMKLTKHCVPIMF